MHAQARSIFRLTISLALALSAAGAVYAALSPRSAAAAPASAIWFYPSSFCSSTLQACINAAGISDTIIIYPGTYITSVTVNKFLWIRGDASTPTIIKALPGQRVMTATQDVYLTYLTLSDGHLSGSSCPASCGGALWLSGSGDAALAYVTLQNNTAWKGGGLYADSIGTIGLTLVDVVSNTIASDGGGINTTATPILQVYGGRITNNQSTSVFGFGGGILADGPVMLSEVDVISNSVSGPGGGVYASSGITTTNGRFERNTAGDQGGGIRSNGSARLDGTNFYSNTAKQGGAVHASGAVTMSYSTVSGNRSTLSDGGALWVGGLLYAAISQYSGNTAAGGGGALFVRGPAALVGTSVLSNSAFVGGGAVISGVANIDGSYFVANSSGRYGGALVFSDTAYLNNAQVIRNSAGAVGGGGAYALRDAVLSGGRFDGNRSTCTSCSGGALFTRRNTHISGTVFYDNDAGQDGGGLYATNGPYLVLSNTQFISNGARLSGGGLYAGTLAAVTGGRFEHNSASLGGGGARFGNALTLSGTQFISNSSFLGGGLWANYTADVGRARFENNQGSSGGGLYAQYLLTLKASQFTGNLADFGGGVYHTGIASGQIINNLFARNAATHDGAALALNASGGDKVLHNTIVDSVLNASSAVAIFSGTVNITDTVIVSHSIGISRTAGSVYEDYNLFFGNTSNTTGSVLSGVHGLSANPAFVNPAAGDYHLSFLSPAIDRGVNAGVSIDVDNDSRPIGAGFDIGFDEVNVRKLWLPLVVR